ncbi:MAG: choice-of-anchor A family protein [Lactobacillus sp.]|jgi:choice-of-anchor A domain-containing protein/LPXTG-motif cell wall-anchored protein|nr:choice-of-anchor A family protein [Lactobacillus sp.]MCI1330384.1 choice-of-anchor A family protein [Lactobacillus sp.]MCI1467090.1 choice-of-anchor A family protein [Lactobacillus sp.]MCI1527935.1 choice-of-anchor A family protein [Lactobacillus sp.]MCI1883989.1 choice-of-anchor A family protein [Lactobacillus sp.]
MLGVGAFASSTPVYATVGTQTTGETQTTSAEEKTTNTEETESGIYQDTTAVKNREQYDTVGKMSQYMAKHNALGVAGEFHLFGNEVTLNADTNGNVAANKFNSGKECECGTRGNSVNASDGDLYYLHDIDHLGDKFRFRNENGSHLVLNKDAEKAEDPNDQSALTIKKDDQTYRIEKGKVNLDDIDNEKGETDYLDINNELVKLSQKSDGWFNEKQSDGVKVDFSDMNKRQIDVSKAKANDQNLVFVDVPAEYLEASQPITISGLSANENAKTIIINVVSGKNSLNVQTQTKLIYDNQREVSPNEKHDYPNRLLWNFGTSMEKVVFSSGYFMGSVLATNAHVEADVNVDGNIVADSIEVKGGETHRWDLTPTPNADFTKPTGDDGSHQENHFDPTTPTGGQDETNKPSQPSESTDDKPGKPDDQIDVIIPGRDENHETPGNNTDVPDLPFPDEPTLKPKHEDSFFEPIKPNDETTVPAKTVSVQTNGIQPKSHQTGFQTVAVSKTAHQQSAAKTTRQASLPQTGGQNVFALLGIMIVSLAAGLYLSAKKHN